ncbi:MAG TPA: hypothetical protein VFT59_05405, partial [Candidatus Saccharimonadales bacterium]|nr:hypothetical protein [Candidatus Saccharimonadales bacterium]
REANHAVGVSVMVGSKCSGVFYTDANGAIWLDVYNENALLIADDLYDPWRDDVLTVAPVDTCV